jgi:hypothetical protein
VLNAGLQKDGLSKEEETRFCGCSYNCGKIVGITGFNAFGGELKVKKNTFKIHVSSVLKRALRKGQKKAFKKLVKANKGGTFAPATSIRSLTNWQVF